MIYYSIRFYVRIILKIFIKRIDIQGAENIPATGPVLLASNHPNSFFDAILLACVLDRPVWSLARGDAFKKEWARRILSKFYMMPIYRLSEGKEYLGKNDETFEKCSALFKKDQQVLIFSEGICTNQLDLLPLKKGTARLARQSWESGLDVTILPVGLSYDTYNKYGKTIQLNFGETFGKNDFENISEDGFFLKVFNEKLVSRLSPLLTRSFKPAGPGSVLYYLGYILHFPVIAPVVSFVRSKTKGTVFFDSVTCGLLVGVTWIYWILAALIISWIL
ncbi:glycerol acyltransferase [Emticicia sp. CRIBPO]|uniref:1-acyl-sn-glycerol-3-phosphate acyltransferase n=1 Tax=Emticicia sp. CRIBPO TaxID=2683258 RepID=UPI001412C834|nr:1-acyl-sn-glycerol-3-phosphate acyltransferase [Emticicia sp. CRIBPO]NBA88090.1 glycerol acyltransferase [Emticicia sp. CRIBPO]